VAVGFSASYNIKKTWHYTKIVYFVSAEKKIFHIKLFQLFILALAAHTCRGVFLKKSQLLSIETFLNLKKNRSSLGIHEKQYTVMW
jgi:hypothetical protein